METDRNLLFGVLALQADLISSEQFAEACSAWAGRKTTPLAELLVERGWLTASDRDDVEKLLRRKLNKHGGDVRASLAEVTGDGVHRTLAGITDPGVQQSLAEMMPGLKGHVLLATTEYVPDARDRYTLSRLHATGGIGRVWLARDPRLGRDVALKELRPERAGHPALWGRFLREAQVTGQLEHPGIVPVYEMGKRPDDQPFYTMRFVRGRTLAEAIRAFHGGDRVDTLGLRELVTAFVGVCNAVAYAHSRGVIHRDLKPQNVVLGDYGEVMVLDWGLAKVIASGERAGDDEPPMVAMGEDGTPDETILGQVLGTPAYMSPEQAEGRLDRLDYRTDVYGLGAVLYELLTGQPVCTGATTEEVLRQVIHVRPQLPRKVRPTVPRALEAVCLKALAKSSAERYGTVKELAGEVRHWLADEPVSAYREPLMGRAGRWARRHRTLTAVAATLLIFGAVGLGVSTALINRQRERAEENARVARDAVDDMYTQVAEKWLSQEAQLEDVQREFLEKALRFYQRQAESQDSSPEIVREAGKAARRAAEIQDRLGDAAAAEASYRHSVSLLEPLRDDRSRAELANTENSLGWYLWVHGQRPDESVKRALNLGEELLNRRSGLALVREVVGGAHSRFGIIQFARGQFSESETSHRKALAVLGELAQEFPDNSYHRLLQARSYGHLGDVLKEVGRFQEAHTAYATSIDIVTAVLAASPRDPRVLLDLAHHLDDHANLLALLGRNGEAEALLRQASEVADRLAADFPGSVPYRELASTIRRDLSNLLKARGEFQDAESDLRQAIETAEELIRLYPDIPAHWRALSVHRGNLGGLLHSVGRPPREVVKEFEKALSVAEDLTTRFSGRLDYRLLCVKQRSSLASVRYRAGEVVEADAEFARVIVELEEVVGEFSRWYEPRHLLADAYQRAATVRSLLTPPGDVRTYLEKSSHGSESLAEEFDLPRDHELAASALSALAQYCLDLDDPGGAGALLERSNRHLEPVLKIRGDLFTPRNIRVKNCSLLAQLQVRSGDFITAEAMARELDVIPVQAREHYNAACYLAVASVRIAQYGAAGPERDSLVKLTSDLAVAHLGKAIKAGYRNLNLITTDPDLTAIRGRTEYEELVQQVVAEVDEATVRPKNE